MCVGQLWRNSLQNCKICNKVDARRFLEGELARRYRDAAPATLALLAERCGGARAELAAAQAHLHALTDVPTLRADGALACPCCLPVCCLLEQQRGNMLCLTVDRTWDCAERCHKAF